MYDEFSISPTEINKHFPLPIEELSTAKKNLKDYQAQITQFTNINFAAKKEFDQLTEKLNTLRTQKSDLVNSIKSLKESALHTEKQAKIQFLKTFQQVNKQFQALYTNLFPGGSACLIMKDPDNSMETGIDININPPGKKIQSMNLLSGGEKALLALILLFAVFSTKPCPLCVLDEVDSSLDTANMEKACLLISQLSKNSQFIIITHNYRTIALGDICLWSYYGRAGYFKNGVSPI